MADASGSSFSNTGFQFDLKLRDYINIARRRKWWIILFTLGFLLTAIVFARRVPNTYKAETVILVDSQEVPDKYVPVILTADIAGRLSTLQQQVLSPTRLKKVVESEGLFPTPDGKANEAEVIAATQKAITVEVVNPGAGKMAAFKIAYSSRNRLAVARIANELAQMFIDANLKAREAQTEGTAQFLETQLDETKRQLDEKDEQLRAIKTRNIDDLPESKAYHLEALANFRGQAQGIQDKIDQDKRDKSMLQSMLASGGPAPTVAADGEGGEDGVAAGVSPYQAQVQKLEQKLADLRSRYGPSHPDVRATQADLNRLKASIQAQPQSSESKPNEAALKPEIQRVQDSHRNPVLEAQIEKLDDDIKEQSDLLERVQSRLDFHTSKLAQEPVFEQQIARLQQDYDSLKTHYAALLDKKEAAEMSYALEVHQQGERFVILDPAETPQKPAAPNRRLIALGGLFLGMLVGSGIAASAELNDQSVRSDSQAARLFEKPVLATVPHLLTPKEHRSRVWRAAGMIAGTVVASVGFGFALSLAAGRLF
jgi:polysaccharide chain length determinant protein (PEP-CTERM system associated)